MAKKEVAQKLIVVESVGAISELGGISGPVLSPCYVPIETINLMLNHHRRVYEVNPKNYKEKVPLTLRNLRKQNFARESIQAKAHLAPNLYTQPIVRNSNDMKGKDFTDDQSTPTPVKVRVPANITKSVDATSIATKKDTTESLTGTSDFTRND